MIELNLINSAANIIKSGGLVAFPTETVYGLGANALDPMAVAKIFTVKERPSFDPLIVHIAKIDDISKLARDYDSRVYQLAHKFWPGPLSIVVEKSSLVPDIVSSGLPTVAIRMPNNPIALALISQSACPIAAPSANKFGRISPTTANHVIKQLPEVECVLDGGSTEIGLESTVISLNEDGFVILRQGFITEQDLLEVIPKSQMILKKENELASPGLLKSHYSPQKPLYIFDDQMPDLDLSKTGFISFTNDYIAQFQHVYPISKTGNLTEAAVNLFAALHFFEDMNDIDYIVAEPVPLHGVGLAIMDRLAKAAFQYN